MDCMVGSMCIPLKCMILKQEEDGPFFPTAYLLAEEGKHSSMRSFVGFRKHLALFEATALDLSLAILQSAHYHAHLSTGYTRISSSFEELRDWFYSNRALHH